MARSWPDDDLLDLEQGLLEAGGGDRPGGGGAGGTGSVIGGGSWAGVTVGR